MRITRDKNAREEALLKKIGAKIKKRRLSLGYDLRTSGDASGISYVQFHKYEEGLARMDCIRMLAIASFLKVSPAYFLEDKEGMQKSEELAIYFNKLSNEIVRDAIVDLCEKISKVAEITS